MINSARRVFFICFALCSASQFSSVLCTGEKNVWHIIISAGFYYEDYAIEASAYHTYHWLLARGIPASNIILFTPDGVAFDKDNPYPGIIHYAEVETTENSKNVYDGVSFDYAGPNCTVENFLAVLSGNKSAVVSGSRKVLNSDADSSLLFYYYGVSYGQYLLFKHSMYPIEEFVQLIEKLYDDGKCSKALFVFDTNSAGVILDNYLKPDGHVMAVTSSGKYEFLAQCFQNIEIEMNTATCFSYLWQQFAEKEPHTPLMTLIPRIQNEFGKTGGKLEMYGDYRLAREPLADFYGPFE